MISSYLDLTWVLVCLWPVAYLLSTLVQLRVKEPKSPNHARNANEKHSLKSFQILVEFARNRGIIQKEQEGENNAVNSDGEIDSKKDDEND